MPEGRRAGFRWIYLAPLLALLSLSAWMLASPVGSSPDDDYHLVSIWCADPSDTAACEAGTDASNRRAPSVLAQEPCFARLSDESGFCQTEMLERRSDARAVTDRGNFVGAYPPVYYATMSLFVGADITASVLIIRFINILLFVGLTTALFVLLPIRLRPPLVLGWLVTTVPLGLFLISSTNPSAWAVMGVGTAWIALLGFFRVATPRRWGLAAIFVVSMVMAAGSRADAAVFALLGLAAVLLLTFAPTKRWFIDAILPAVMAVLSIALLLTSRQTGSATSGFGDTPTFDTVVGEVDRAALGFSNIKALPDIWAGVFGSWDLGWFDTDIPIVVLFGAGVAFAAVSFVGLTEGSWRKFAVVAGGVTALVVVPLYVLYQGSDAVGQAVQPRYLLPLIVMVAGFTILAPRSGAFRLSRAQLVVVATLLFVAQIFALHATMRRFITGNDVSGINLDNGLEWWWSIPASPMLVLIAGSIAYGALVVVLLREVTSTPPESDGRRTEAATTVAAARGVRSPGMRRHPTSRVR